MKAFQQSLAVSFIALFSISASAVTRYVDVNNASPSPPYTNWITSATNIQDAVDAAEPGDLVLVTNGVYQTGGRALTFLAPILTNRVAITQAITLQSVNGAAVTTIRGFQMPGVTNGDSAIRCVYLADGAVLSGFTLMNGATLSAGSSQAYQSAGGVWCESTNASVLNCVLQGNRAKLDGAGACSGLLTNCVFVGNSAGRNGGGAYGSYLIGCLLSGNSAAVPGGAGGGVSQSTVIGSTISNSSCFIGGGASDSVLENCLVTSNRSTTMGGGLHRCNASNCVISSNISGTDGGGSFSGILDNCSVISNSAKFSGGGGAMASIMNNCLVAYNHAGSLGGGLAGGGQCSNCVMTGNSAALSGGAISQSSAVNCTIVGNFATNSGGGAYGRELWNCIVYDNSAPDGPNYVPSSSVNNCCTFPLPDSGNGNFTNAPLFVDQFGGNLRLQSNSPCINAGNDAFVSEVADLDGNPRIVGETVDIGAYEFQSPQSVISYAWLQHYGLPTDGSADYANSDTDLQNNWQEWKSDTDPTNSESFLEMLSPMTDPSGILAQWRSTNSRTYFLERATDLASQPSFSALASNIVGQAGTTTYTDTSATNGGLFFYRVGVQ